MTEPSASWHSIDTHRVRLLRDGAEAFPAMLAAIAEAEREILLAMYWIGADSVGVRFRDALAERARSGVAVFVTYDGVGSLGLFRSFWTPLLDAGGHVLEHGPVAPWRRRFRLDQLLFRDHRKILVVDTAVAFCGGLNLALQWLPCEEGGQGWRDDVVEMRGPAVLALHAISCRPWLLHGGVAPAAVPLQQPASAERVQALSNRIGHDRTAAFGAPTSMPFGDAQTSIDIANPYFLPGPLLIKALQQAHDRGVKVRLLVSLKSDVWLADVAMRVVLEGLVRHGIAVYTYEPSVMHAKTATFDERTVIVGSHNLDTFSWRFNLEANVRIVDASFAATVVGSFERDLRRSIRLPPATDTSSLRLSTLVVGGCSSSRALVTAFGRPLPRRLRRAGTTRGMNDRRLR